MSAETTPTSCEVINRHYNVTLLFNAHGTPEDARRTLANVADNSLIFSEGTMLDPAYARDRVASLIGIAARRLELGLYDDESSRHFYQLAEIFRTRANTPENEYDVHSYSLFRGAHAKGCVLLPADFLNVEEDDLSRFDGYFDPEPPHFTVEGDLFKDAIRFAHASRQANAARFEWLDFREQRAVEWTEHFLLRFRSTMSGIATDAYGRLRAYVLFGSAHRNSLTEKFKDKGIEVGRIVLDEAERIPEDDFVFQRNRPRMDFNRRAVLHYLGTQMATAIETEDFERAAAARDLICTIEKMK